MIEALIGITSALLLAIGVFIGVFRAADGEWPWETFLESRAAKKRIEGTMAERDQKRRIQALEHELGLLPHSDSEIHCPICVEEMRREVEEKWKVANSWRVKPWDGRWRPAGVGKNLYPDRVGDVEVTGLGSAAPEYISGTNPYADTMKPEVFRK